MEKSLTIKEIYKGVIIPMLTPFQENLEIDLVAAKRIAEHLIQNNCAVFVLGTTGEAVSISSEKKYAFVNAVVKAVNKKQKVYAGISSNCFDEATEFANRFHDLGADALVAHLPAFYPLNDKHIVHYFEQLADVSPLPLILYNIPATTHHSMSLEVIKELSEHKNIIGLKDSERGDERLDQSLELWKDREDFVFHLGWAAKSSYGLQNGLDGIVPSTGNLVPHLYNQLFIESKAGNSSKAELLQQITNEISAFYQAGNLLSEALPRLKTMMKAFELCEPFVASPMLTVDIELQKQIKSDVLQRFSTYNSKVI